VRPLLLADGAASAGGMYWLSRPFAVTVIRVRRADLGNS